jgi:hypothetical protein
MKKNLTKGTANDPITKKGVQRTTTARQKQEVTDKTNSEAKSTIKFLWWEVTFTNESWKYRVYVITLFVVATIAIIWLVKAWALVTTFYKKMSGLKIKSLLGKGPPIDLK